MKVSDVFETLDEIVWRDQFAHFAAGLLIAAVLQVWIHPSLAVIVSVVAAAVREMVQHPRQCGAGCRTDLAFWTLGALSVLVV